MSDERHLANIRERVRTLHEWPTFGIVVRDQMAFLLAQLDDTRAALAAVTAERDAHATALTAIVNLGGGSGGLAFGIALRALTSGDATTQGGTT